MKINLFNRLPFLVLFLLFDFQGLSQENQLLFQKKEVLKINVQANLKALQKDRGEKSIAHWANLTYTDDQNKVIELPLKVKTRGHFRKDPSNCSFPPLLVDFAKKKSKNTLFEGQDKLKLVAKCRTENFIINEYLVYEIYNLISDYSFKARLVEVTYSDSLNKKQPETAYGFFIEDEKNLAKRNGIEKFERKNFPMSAVDSVNMATMMVFEYMIGNNDFSLAALHNIKLFSKNGNSFIPVAYDFDYSGIVETFYATPPIELEITSVRERLYRGLNYSPAVFKQIFDKFNSVKPQIYALYEGNTLLDAGYIKRTIKYLDKFYEIINDSKAINKYFVAGKTKN